MFVPCPHCGYLVALIVTDGDASQPCPRCDKPLDALVEAPPSVAPPLAEQAADRSPEPARTATPGPENAAETATTPALDEAAPAAAMDSGTRANVSAATTARRRPSSRQPNFLRAIAAPARPDGKRWPGIVAACVLSALLVLQLLLSQRAELAATERWRPVIETTCTVLGCDVPLWHQPAAYTMLARDVQPVAGRAGVLQVRASFRNDARWPQAWPVLQLQLTDVNGQPVAARLLQPDDYHSADATPPPLAPGQSASVTFHVAEPATPIVAFNFDFR